MQAMNASEAELTKKLAESGPMKMLALKTHELVTRLRSPNDPRYHHLRNTPIDSPFLAKLRSARAQAEHAARNAQHVASAAGRKFVDEVKNDLAKKK